MSKPLQPLDLVRWIEENAESFQPPVSNRVVWSDSEFITMVVRGPNARNDFHIDPGDEIFYQLRGTIRVDIRTKDGVTETHLVREGELFLVPAGVPHAPMRPADTWGLVIERQRRADELDQIVWFCPDGHELHRRSFALADIETELAAIINEFNTSPTLRTCGTCAKMLDVPGPFVLDDVG